MLPLLHCKAQILPFENIVAVEQVIDNYDAVEEGETTYIKDVNNVLDNYTGVWKGTIGAKNYTFNIYEKTIVYDEEYNIIADVLIMKYLIVDSISLEVIEDSTVTLGEDFPCKGAARFNMFSGNEMAYVFDYIGMDSSKVACGQNGEVYATLKNNNTQLFLKLSANHYLYNECLTGLVEQVLPAYGILLTKQ